MDKYQLNYLRLLTNGEISDKVLKTVDPDSIKGIKLKDGKFSFKAKVKVNTKNWRGIYGSVK